MRGYYDNIRTMQRLQSEIEKAEIENCKILRESLVDFRELGEFLVENDYVRFMDVVKGLFEHAHKYLNEQDDFIKGSPNDLELLELIRVMK